jgi:hypothetical protein
LVGEFACKIKLITKEMLNSVAVGKGSDEFINKIMNKKGFIVFIVKGWSNATGHITLWDGLNCEDETDYFDHDPGVTNTNILFWELK